MTAIQTIKRRLLISSILRRADARQAGPILRYELIDEEPSARPVAWLCVTLALGFGLLMVLDNLKREPVAAQQCFPAIESRYVGMK